MGGLEQEVAERLKNFSLSVDEGRQVELQESDTRTGYEEGERSLIGKFLGKENSISQE